MYNPSSTHADEFIDHAEVLETLDQAARLSRDGQRVDAILEKAARCKGLTHREAAVLLDCDDPVREARLYELAGEIKRQFYGNRIVLFAPLYLSNAVLQIVQTGLASFFIVSEVGGDVVVKITFL